MKNFPTTPSEIINHFNLRTPIYKMSAKSHFGNDIMPWEKLDKVEILRSELSLQGQII
jgi:S-adenosylmethionine synthetase